MCRVVNDSQENQTVFSRSRVLSAWITLRAAGGGPRDAFSQDDLLASPPSPDAASS